MGCAFKRSVFFFSFYHWGEQLSPIPVYFTEVCSPNIVACFGLLDFSKLQPKARDTILISVRSLEVLICFFKSGLICKLTLRTCMSLKPHMRCLCHLFCFTCRGMGPLSLTVSPRAAKVACAMWRSCRDRQVRSPFASLSLSSRRSWWRG